MRAEGEMEDADSKQASPGVESRAHAPPRALLCTQRCPTTMGDMRIQKPQADACTHTHQLFTREAAKMLDPGPESQNRSLLRDCLSIQRVSRHLGGLMKQ